MAEPIPIREVLDEQARARRAHPSYVVTPRAYVDEEGHVVLRTERMAFVLTIEEAQVLQGELTRATAFAMGWKEKDG